MNVGLCRVHGHHIPLEALGGAQQSGGEGRPGQERPGEETLSSVMQHDDHIKECGSVMEEVIVI